MEQVKKTDRRVIKTKKAIKTAFIDLLSEKEMIEITVKELADKADVDRKTLYNYYDSTYSVLAEVENDLVSWLEESVSKIDIEKNLDNPLHIFEIIAEIVNSNFELCVKLMKIETNSQLMAKMSDAIASKIMETIKTTNRVSNKYDLEAVSVFITAGSLATFQRWLNTGKKQSIEDLSKQVGISIVYGLTGLTK